MVVVEWTALQMPGRETAASTARHGNDCLWIVAQYLFGEAFDYDFAGKGSGRPWQAAELSNTRVPVGCESAFFWSS
jgi:hypothetical protein